LPSSVLKFHSKKFLLRLKKNEVLDEQTAEQRGWHWTLTSFAVEAWSKTKDEMACRDGPNF
jgi:hypothetical protein